LTAAISVVPILTLFYRLVELNRSIERIVLEMNRELRKTMPSGRFVAATLLAYDPRASQVRLWQGGMPEVLHLDAAGNTLARHASDQLPMGIVDCEEGMTAVRTLSVSDGDQIVLFSDGLIEAENAAGEMFGIERVEQAMRENRNKDRLGSLQDALRRHAGARPPHDDVSVMIVTCRTA
jgi:serine phosphatase RsbU (regulator of sigma subunit)